MVYLLSAIMRANLATLEPTISLNLVLTSLIVISCICLHAVIVNFPLTNSIYVAKVKFILSQEGGIKGKYPIIYNNK